MVLSDSQGGGGGPERLSSVMLAKHNSYIASAGLAPGRLSVKKRGEAGGL